MLAPALILFAGFILVPVVLTVIGSLFSFGITSPTWSFAGLDNYVTAINDPVFWLSLRNNLIIVFGSIVTQIGFGTLLAAILDRGIRRGSTFFRTLIFAPMVISSVAVGLIWLMILDPNIGPLNRHRERHRPEAADARLARRPEPRHLDVPGGRHVAVHRLHDGARPRRPAGRAERDLPGGRARRRPRHPRLLVHHAADRSGTS